MSELLFTQDSSSNLISSIWFLLLRTRVERWKNLEFWSPSFYNNSLDFYFNLSSSLNSQSSSSRLNATSNSKFSFMGGGGLLNFDNVSLKGLNSFPDNAENLPISLNHSSSFPAYLYMEIMRSLYFKLPSIINHNSTTFFLRPHCFEFEGGIQSFKFKMSIQQYWVIIRIQITQVLDSGFGEK